MNKPDIKATFKELGKEASVKLESYPNRETLRRMYKKRDNRTIKFDEFRLAVKMQIDYRNAKRIEKSVK